MTNKDLIRIKEFIRISFELEEMLQISWAEKKVLLRTIFIWTETNKLPSITQVSTSIPQISESSVYRHLKVLIKKGWLKTILDRQDHRIKYIEPTPRLLKVLALKI